MPKLEAALTEHLRPVVAPAELWERLHISRDPHQRKSPRPGSLWLAWAGAAMVLAASSATGLHTYLKSR